MTRATLEDVDLDNLRVIGGPATISLYGELARTALIVLGVEHASVKMWSGRWGIVCLSGPSFSWEISQTVGDPHSSRHNYDLTFKVTSDDKPFELDEHRVHKEFEKHGFRAMILGGGRFRVWYPESQRNPAT